MRFKSGAQNLGWSHGVGHYKCLQDMARAELGERESTWTVGINMQRTPIDSSQNVENTSPTKQRHLTVHNSPFLRKGRIQHAIEHCNIPERMSSPIISDEMEKFGKSTKFPITFCRALIFSNLLIVQTMSLSMLHQHQMVRAYYWQKLNRILLFWKD